MNTSTEQNIRLTEFSHGAGCGCKISPEVLERILASVGKQQHFPDLLVGNQTKDDAAVFQIDEQRAIISTTDFFMPIVDDAFTFGRIAATNAISDIYAMGGKPLMAIAIFGWPVNQLPASLATKVIDGGRQACEDAGIPLAGGHSIDTQEPIFGLAVTGEVALAHLKANNAAKLGDKLYLTKPLGIGILTTAEKKSLLKPEHQQLATELMCQLNHFGTQAAKLTGVNAMTDVTGFGLLGHLLEICQGSGTSAEINASQIPLLDGVKDYLALGAVPGGTYRNLASYEQHIECIDDELKLVLADPQTSGGLLISVAHEHVAEFEALAKNTETQVTAIGEMIAKQHKSIRIKD